MLGTVLLVLGSCSDNKGINPDLPLAQHYRVEKMEWDGTVNCFANFTAYDAAGDLVRVKLDNGASVKANNRMMTYNRSDLTDPMSYDYTASFDGGIMEVTFTFVRNSTKTFVNSINIADIPVVVPPALTDIQNGVRYEAELNGISPSSAPKVQVIMSESKGGLTAKTYEADVFYGGSNVAFTFNGVPAGTYDVRFLSTVSNQVVQSNGVAGGEIDGCRVSRLMRVNVR